LLAAGEIRERPLSTITKFGMKYVLFQISIGWSEAGRRGYDLFFPLTNRIVRLPAYATKLPDNT
jgi:hypothetical protein